MQKNHPPIRLSLDLDVWLFQVIAIVRAKYDPHTSGLVNQHGYVWTAKFLNRAVVDFLGKVRRVICRHYKLHFLNR